jgi:PHP family Zn ribbon phosphoesterase
MEVLAYVSRKTKYSVAVNENYNKLIEAFGTEMNILLDASTQSIGEVAGEDVALAIENVRTGRIRMEPGYAGVYGKLDLLFRDKGKAKMISTGQRSLFDQKPSN